MMLARFSQVAVISDVHGNAVAMAALAEAVIAEQPDALVFCGDLTWGSQPEETWSLIGSLRERVDGPSFLVRGNAERALAELRAGVQQKEPTDRERWMLAHHRDAHARRARDVRDDGRPRRGWARPDALLPRLAAQRRGADHDAHARARGSTR